MFEAGAITVGGKSIITLIITKLNCYAKKNGSCNYGIACMDKPLLDDDETEMKTIDLGDSVHVMHVKNKRHYVVHEHEESESYYETDDD